MLRSYLATCACETFRWGERDCALFVADWVRLVTGRDPASHLRGRYRDAGGALALAGTGGLVGIVARCARDAGLQRVKDAAPGAIGVVRDPAGTVYCAIRSATGWVARTDAGLIVADPRAVRVIAAWEVG